MNADDHYTVPASEYESCRGLRPSHIPVRSGDALLAAMGAVPGAIVVAGLASLHYKLQIGPALALYALAGAVIMAGLLAWRLWRTEATR